MIRVDCEQGTAEWFDARAAIPTASEAKRVVTPSTLQYAAGAATYAAELLVEWALGYAVTDTGQSAWMTRGTEMEQAARDWYAYIQDVEVERVGFTLTDDGTFGYSPDGLVGEDGAVELKVPAAHTHIRYMLNPKLLVAEYRHQVQSGLYVTGRQWCDLASYNPDLPKVLERVERDEKYILALHKHLRTFTNDLNKAKRELVRLGFTPRPGTEPPPEVEETEAEELVAAMYGAADEG
jgi:hypothetical protein